MSNIATNTFNNDRRAIYIYIYIYFYNNIRYRDYEISLYIYRLLVAVRYCVDLHTEGEARGIQITTIPPPITTLQSNLRDQFQST